MIYVEMTVEEAMKRCNKHDKVLVAVQDLEDNNVNIPFVLKKREEYEEMFEDIKTAVSFYDDFIKQLRLFTEKQEDIYNIQARGLQKTVMLKE